MTPWHSRSIFGPIPPDEEYRKTYNNRSLFSDYYLEELAREDPHWRALTSRAAAYRQHISEILTIAVPGLDRETPEAEVEQRLIRPVLDALGHVYFVQPAVPSSEGVRRPDYAFFASPLARQIAETHKGRLEFFRTALAMGDAKAWERSLDKRVKGPGDPFSNHNPSYQIDFYLRASQQKWGMLTNGRHWRLYNRDLSYRLDVYYEVDLLHVSALEGDGFLYFLALFHKSAFERDGAGPCFLDRAYSASTEYASRISDELKDNVYEALRVLAEGFLMLPDNHLTAEHLDLVRESAFIIIYRLLFIFYAEARGFLPVKNPTYADTYSLGALTRDVANKDPFERTLHPTATRYWSRLRGLFGLVDKGDDFLGIPPYDGRLFNDEGEHKGLAVWQLGDRYLATAIDYLARAKAAGRDARGFVSYRDLSIRNLGSIYEGLLEHRPRQASWDMAVVREDKHEKFVPVAELAGRRPLKTYRAGSIYLETDKGERKTTGSYYTPQYIVEYIVGATVGPLLEEVKGSGGNVIDAILALKVLDPAMGSGHFLVEATDYLARALVEALGGDPREMDEDEIRWARREVVERCIYGVDSNPLAVDLAKLSLWLSTVSLDKPLNFLDHHLRCGNSLIGARLEDLGQLPLKAKNKPSKTPASQGLVEYYFHQNVATAVDNYFRIAATSSDSLQEVKEKEKLYGIAQDILKRYRQVAHIWSSTFFGNEVTADRYMVLQDKIRAPEAEWADLEKLAWFEAGLALGEQLGFFHWELEFPEVFFDRNGQAVENSGFDVVLGNPPYEELSEAAAGASRAERDYFARVPAFSPALGGRLNLFRLFVVRALEVTRNSGLQSYIVPLSLLSDLFALGARKLILNTTRVLQIENFPQKDDPRDRVFKDAKLSTAIYVIRKASPPAPFFVRTHAGKDIDACSPSCEIDPEALLKFDPVNLSIPQVDQGSWQLAKKLATASNMTRLAQVCRAYPGEIMLNAQFRRYLSNDPTPDLLLRGGHIWRYEFNLDPKQGDPVYLKSELYMEEHGNSEKARHHLVRRIAFQRGSPIDNWRRIVATMIEPGWFCTDTVGYLVPSGELDPFAILALVNSSISEWRFRLTSTNNHVSPYELAAIPIRRIGFDCRPATREKLLSEAIGLYECGHSWSELQGVIDFVRTLLPEKQSGTPDPEREQADVVHDLLAFMAARLTTLSTEKQDEAAGFVRWIESYLGVPVEHLKNRTLLKEYWQAEASWEDFVGSLERNRRAIQSTKGFDVMRREPQETIRTEYEASRAKLGPLLERIALTDKLIDQVVYRLYGLTEEEIAIVERRA